METKWVLTSLDQSEPRSIRYEGVIQLSKQLQNWIFTIG